MAVTLVELGKVFREARIKSRKTQEEAAGDARIDLSAVQRLESGKTNPTFETMRALAEATGWRLIVSLDGEDGSELLSLFRSADPSVRDAILRLVRTMVGDDSKLRAGRKRID